MFKAKRRSEESEPANLRLEFRDGSEQSCSIFRWRLQRKALLYWTANGVVIVPLDILKLASLSFPNSAK
jgi:hypothetical protein